MQARLAQSVERETFNLKAKGSSPLSGEFFLETFLSVIYEITEDSVFRIPDKSSFLFYFLRFVWSSKYHREPLFVNDIWIWKNALDSKYIFLSKSLKGKQIIYLLPSQRRRTTPTQT